MTTTFQELCTLEPRLRELEADVRGVTDDGQGEFFCSNFLWLPLNARLRFLVGVARSGGRADGSPDMLWSSRSYERAYDHLSALLPPCRNCGCRRFERFRN